MMNRQQRLDYEILHCTLNEAPSGEGYTTTLAVFIKRLGRLFPDVEAFEFTDACARLYVNGALHS